MSYFDNLINSLRAAITGDAIVPQGDPNRAEWEAQFKDPNTYIAIANTLLPVGQIAVKTQKLDAQYMRDYDAAENLEGIGKIAQSTVQIANKVSYMARQNYSTAYTWKGDSPDNKTWFNKAGTIEYSRYPKTGFKKSKYPNSKGKYNYYRKVSSSTPASTSTSLLSSSYSAIQSSLPSVSLRPAIPDNVVLPPSVSLRPDVSVAVTPATPVTSSPDSSLPATYTHIQNTIAQLQNLTPVQFDVLPVYEDFSPGDFTVSPVAAAPVAAPALPQPIEDKTVRLAQEWYNANIQAIGESFSDTFGDYDMSVAHIHAVIASHEERFKRYGLSYTPYLKLAYRQ